VESHVRAGFSLPCHSRLGGTGGNVEPPGAWTGLSGHQYVDGGDSHVYRPRIQRIVDTTELSTESFSTYGTYRFTSHVIRILFQECFTPCFKALAPEGRRGSGGNKAGTSLRRFEPFLNIGVDLSCLSETWSGMRRYAFNFSKQLKKQYPDDVTLFVFEDAREMPASDVYQITKKWTSSRVLREQLLVPIHGSDCMNRLLVPAYLGPVISPVPVDLIVFDLLFLRNDFHGGYRQKLYWRGLYQWVFRKADRLFPISETTRERVIEHLPWTSTKMGPVLYPGAPDSPEVYPEGSNQRNDFILTVGTVSPRKNMNTLVRAYRECPNVNQNVDLRIVGQYGWGSPHPTSFHDPAEGVHWEGEVSDQILHEMYEQATLLVLPSRGEGFGLPILEAFHHDLPVVLSDLEVFHEVAADAAWYLPDDQQDWCDVIDTALRDNEHRQRNIKRGRRRLEEFSWSKSVSRYLDTVRDG